MKLTLPRPAPAALATLAPLAAAVLAACDVTPPAGAPAGAGDGGVADPRCPRGLLVVSSDYASTSVSVLAPDGRVLAPTLASSQGETKGLAARLSGDVVLPHDPPPSGAAVLLDRYPASTLTWIDPASAAVRGQLDVGAGFAANPHDYLEVRTDKAYVTRYESNPAPGARPFDRGGDLLVVDPTRGVVMGTVDLAAEGDGFLPRPDRMTRVGDLVLVALDRMDAAFKQARDARLLAVRPGDDAIAARIDLHDLANCGGLARAPSGATMAVACSGVFAEGHARQVARSGIVLLDLTATPPREKARFSPSGTLGAPLARAVAFASETLLVGVAFGDAQAGRPDRAYTLDTTTGAVAPLVDGRSAFALGEVACTPGCGNRCFLADAEGPSPGLALFTLSGGALLPSGRVQPDSAYGLPPRTLGSY